MLVGMFTGMRIEEIASLTWDRIRTTEGVTYIQVEDAKTPAGNRRVPIHPALGWLKLCAQSNTGSTARIWPLFNEEGPGKKAGADAGKEFSRHKLARGFDDR
jgi:integrase